MEYASEIINISKIKEGFYIGDRFAGTNLEVIIHFKITHIINAAAAQIINTFETIGIKYLSLIWSDHQNQKLFTSNDEIVDRIIGFIDDSLTSGEGLLVHSVKGQNRVCIVVVIYLMKKFKWGLMKCIDFLHSKKADVNISKPYLSQLAQFEMRLTKVNQVGCVYSHDWNDDSVNSAEEMLLRNTYVNGLPYKVARKSNLGNNKKCSKATIGWADFNPFNPKDTLVHPNSCKDLIMQKDVQPVTSHLKLRPSKSCVKFKKEYEDTNKEADCYHFNSNDIKSVKYQVDNANDIDDDEHEEVKMNHCDMQGIFTFQQEERQGDVVDHLNNNNFNSNAQFHQSIANMHDIKQKHNLSNKSNNEEKNNDNSPISCGQNIRLIPSQNRPGESNNNNERMNNFKTKKMNKKVNENILPKRPSTVERNSNINHSGNKFIDGNIKGFIMKNSFTYGFNSTNKKKVNEHYNIESIQKPLTNSIEKKSNYINSNKPTDNQRLIINNYVNESSLKKNNSNDALLPYQSQMSKDFMLSTNLSANDINILRNYQPKLVPFKVNSTTNNNSNQNYILSYTKPLNNFDPALMKKSQNMFLRSSHSFEKGPIKLSKECMIRKPLTPDQMLYINAMKPKKKSKVFNKNNYNEIYGTLVQKPGNNLNINNEMNYFRPSTAPQKDKQQRRKSSQKKKRSNDDPSLSNPVYINPIYPAMKRLPSPMIQSNHSMHYNRLSSNAGSSIMKSPHLILKSNVLSMDPYKSIPLIK